MFAWYEEDLTSFFLKYNLPTYSDDSTIKNFIESYAIDFLKSFEEMISMCKHRSLPTYFYDKVYSCKKGIQENFQRIISVLTYYDTSEMAKAQQKFDVLMDSLQDSLIISDISGCPGRWLNGLYRIRESDAPLTQPKDLFHIPLNLRHLITNERYSIAGHPCLYLSTFLGIAWQECGYPKNFYYSQFEMNEEFKEIKDWEFINFLSPRSIAHDFLCAINEKHNDARLIAITNYLKTFPLIMACSIVNLNGKSIFKSEYVIPQILTQWVRRNFKRVKGILYFSCYDNDSLMQINGYNVMIPATEISDCGFCSKLAKAFKVSTPVYCDNFLGLENQKVIHAYRKDLLIHMSDFPAESFECMSAIYNVANHLDNFCNYFETSDMKLLLEGIRSIRLNCSYIVNRFSKLDILTKISADSHLDSFEGRRNLFETYYDTFFNRIKPVVDDYCSSIDKVFSQKTNEFFDVRY